jgi:hypothetical protein
MAIPFAGLNRTSPAGGERWRANLFRIDLGAGSKEEYDAWSPPQKRGQPPAFHLPSRFGRLVFAAKAPAAPPLSR